VHGGHRHRREGFVDLEQVDVLGGPAGLLEQLLQRADRRGGEQVRLLRVGGVADDLGDRRQAQLPWRSIRASSPARRRRR
jgi:hypothetical protein